MAMISMQGKGVSGGLAQGTVHFFRRAETAVRREAAGTPQEELARFDLARQRAAGELASLAEQARTSAGEEAALLFETHALLMEDEDFSACVREAVEAGCSAGYAVQEAGKRFAAMLGAMEDDYMRARAADVEDVARRLLRGLTGEAEACMELPGPVVVAADDLSPSETIRLDRHMVLAFITRGGSDNSHAAILARTMGIPAVCGLGDGLSEAAQGRLALVDGDEGSVVLEPDGAALSAHAEKRAQQQARMALWQSQRGREDVAPDGRRISICCNIGSPEDIASVLENDGRGVGLFRSEFLCLASGGFPGEEEQLRAYREVVDAVGGRRVVIRTLDVGADKQADFLGLPREENPALGMRGVRVSLSRPETFRTQLRAIYRASAFGRVAILFPMIASLWEVQECKRMCRRVMEELEAEGVPFRRETELGVMIETPASVLLAEEMAREVDFFSVGTNDLTQYTLACDRQADGMERFCAPRHPAVLRAVRMAAEAAHRAGIWIGICGEMAADEALLSAFLDMGIDELSVPAPRVLPLRAALRGEN
jgi:phosphotransferase system enzyme I (PtsI)